MKRKKVEKTKHEISSKAQEIVTKYVELIPGWKKYTNTDCVVCCPFHEENTPSCGIKIVADDSIPVGFWFCWGCGKKGPWDLIAEKYNFPKIKDSDYQIDRVFNRDMDEIKAELLVSKNDRTIEDYVKTYGQDSIVPIPYNSTEKWRGIKGQLIKRIDGKIIFDKKREIQMLLLPVVVHDDMVGIIKARMKKEKGQLSYVTSKGAWVKRSGLFPFNEAMRLARKSKTIVIVEGPRDALRLVQMGIPAVAVLGTRNWSKKKLDLLLTSGIRKIIVCLDGDEAGESAAVEIVKDIKHVIRYKDFTSNLVEKTIKDRKWNERHPKREQRPDTDPANMPMEMVRKLKRLCSV